MRKIIMSIFVALLIASSLCALPPDYPNSREDAPFGLRWGMSLGDLYRECIMIDLELGNIFGEFDIIPPEPSYLFEFYSVTAKDKGLILIEARNEHKYNSTDRGTGTLRDALSNAKFLISDDYEIYSLLRQKYGEPQRKKENIDLALKPSFFTVLFTYEWSNNNMVITYQATLSNNSSKLYEDDLLKWSVVYCLYDTGKTKLGLGLDLL